VAEAFLARKDAWVAPHRVDDRAIFEDPVPLLLGALLHTGGIGREEFEQKRATWLETWTAKSSDAYFHYLWIYAYGQPTEGEAEAALAALPKFAPMPTFIPQTNGFAPIGRVYWAAQKWNDALSPLTAADASCATLYFPFSSTRATLMLGDVKAAVGDKENACA